MSKGKQTEKPARRSKPRGVISAQKPSVLGEAGIFNEPGDPPPQDATSFLKFEETFDLVPTVATDNFVEVISATPADMSMIHTATQRYVQKWVPPNRQQLIAELLPQIDVVPRDQEERFLREPRGGEQACERGKDCEGMEILGVDQPRPLVAFHTIKQRTASKETQTLLPAAPCLMCRRSTAGYFFMNARCELPRMDQPGAGQANKLRNVNPHANKVGHPGEYDESHVIAGGTPETHGATWPIVMHVRTKYDPYKDDNGVLCFAQRGYTLPDENSQDFQ